MLIIRGHNVRNGPTASIAGRGV